MGRNNKPVYLGIRGPCPVPARRGLQLGPLTHPCGSSPGVGSKGSQDKTHLERRIVHVWERGLRCEDTPGLKLSKPTPEEGGPIFVGKTHPLEAKLLVPEVRMGPRVLRFWEVFFGEFLHVMNHMNHRQPIDHILRVDSQFCSPILLRNHPLLKRWTPEENHFLLNMAYFP